MDKIAVEEMMETSNVVAYLEGLVKGFKEGKIVIERGGESLTMIPPAWVDVEVEAKQKKGKAKFSLELSWQLPAASEEPLNVGSEPSAPAISPAGATDCAAGHCEG
jgi:amphi-Trp domain-containing protein